MDKKDKLTDDYFNNSNIPLKERIENFVNQKSTRGYTRYLKNNAILLKEVIAYTSFLPDSSEIPERVFNILYPEKVPNLCCKHNNKPLFNTLEKGYRKFCANQCKCKKEEHSKKIAYNRSLETKEEKESREQKRKDTCMERYGTDNPMKNSDMFQLYKEKYKENTGYDTPMDNPEVKNKIKKNYREKTGYDTPLENPEIRNKIWEKRKEVDPTMETARKTYNQQTGYNNAFQVPENKEKIKQTKNKKYGVEYYSQTDEWNEKVKKTSQEIYNRDHHTQKNISDKAWEILNNKNLFEDMYQKNSIQYMCNFLNVEWNTIVSRLKHYNIAKKESRSSYEDSIAFLLKSLGVKYTTNNYSICKEAFGIKREIDFVIEDKKLCIEMNGIYFHSEISGNKNSTYHLKKLEACEKLGYRLLTITDKEWDEKNTIVVQKIKHALGYASTNNNTRNLIIKEITEHESNLFLYKYHLQGGSYNNEVCLGAYDDNKLVSVMTFGRPIMNKNSILDFAWDLKRYCGNENYYPGLASKLLKYFEINYKPYCILSYANRRWSTGDLYKKLGFDLIHYTKPSYDYISPNKKEIFNRTTFKKSKIIKKFNLPSDFEFVEKDFMISQGYDIIWDCGNIRFEKWYNKKPS